MISLPMARMSVARLGHIYSHRSRVVSLPHSRFLSTDQLFNASISASVEVPPLPSPPSAAPSLNELVESGQSVLSELGLICWWKPSSYFRLALEGIHMHADIPWWATIVSATVVLRLALIAVPVMSQKLVAKQSKYKKELGEFRERSEEARREGNNLLQQQIFLEQRDFLKAKDIKMGRQLMVLLANGGVFATQFFALKRMIEVGYPGLSTGGALWFTDLAVADPYYVLPLLSAATMAIVMRSGLETGASSESMPPAMRLGMMYGLPVIVFAFSSQFASGICLYWCTSNIISLAYAGLFRLQPVRKLFKIPPVVKDTTPKRQNAWKETYNSLKASRQVPPSLSQLKRDDDVKFDKAGKSKPGVAK